jgi:hypothetical protein
MHYTFAGQCFASEAKRASVSFFSVAPSARTEGVLPQHLFAAVAFPLYTLTPKERAIEIGPSASKRIVMAELANVTGHTVLPIALPSIDNQHTREYLQGFMNSPHVEFIDPLARVERLLECNLLWPTSQPPMVTWCHERPQTIFEMIEPHDVFVRRMRTHGCCFEVACEQWSHHS